ncbi:MAG: hypothetical protein PHI85_09330 [Victivallaceae bacterium]|nr:hypothetical protein [Victivallaceae bacterium]
MALAKIGKFYHIKYRDLSGMPRSRTTGKTVKAEAEADERVWMAQIRAERQRRKHGDFLEAAANVDRMVAVLDGTKRRKRLKLSDALDRYRQLYGEPARAAYYYYQRFARSTTLRYLDEVSPDYAAKYLWETYAKSGKSFNEAKMGLNTIFKRLLVYAGMSASPFAVIANRSYKGGHQRKLTDEEVQKLIAHTSGPLAAAIFIAWHTGFRGTSCAAFKWNEIREDNEHHGKYIFHLPPKTSRYNREVVIPLHPELDVFLASLPVVNQYVLGYGPPIKDGEFMRTCRECGIATNEQGCIKFGSIRKNFISRCDANGIRRSATRGMAGHTEDDMTDLYSEDYAGALEIVKLPGIGQPKK